MIPKYLKEQNFNSEKLYDFIDMYYTSYYEVNCEYLEFVFIKTRINYIHLMDIVNWPIGKINSLYESNNAKIEDIKNCRHNRFWKMKEKRMALFSLRCSQHLIQQFIKAKYWQDISYVDDEMDLDTERKAIFENVDSVESDFTEFYSSKVENEISHIRRYLKSKFQPPRNKSEERYIILDDDNKKSDSMIEINKQKTKYYNYTEEKRRISKKENEGKTTKYGKN
jgi:hypothetical protein